jgi:hypothetical protein
MYALHDLICRDARVLNRNAGKMYGFLPGVVTAVSDPKQKRHQRGYVKVCFPGLQDTPTPDPKAGSGGLPDSAALKPSENASKADPMINPWARLVVANAGGMIEAKKTKKVKVIRKVWTRTPRQIPYEIDVETEEPVFDEVEEITETEKKEKLQFQRSLPGASFKTGRPWQGEQYNADIWLGGGEGQTKGIVSAAVAEIQKALPKTESGKIVVYIDGHTDTCGWTGTEVDPNKKKTKGGFDGNINLSNRRVAVVRNFFVEELNKAGPEVSGRVEIKEHGFGESMAGEIRDEQNPQNWKVHGPANPKSKQVRNTDQQVEDAACRRVDITFAYDQLKWRKEVKVTKKKVQVGVKKVLKKVKGQRTVYDLKLEEKEDEIEVPIPGKPSGTGFYCPPQIGDEVLCAFEHGDMHFPYVLGSLWNGKSKLPEPSTPGDTKRDKNGPQTPAMKGDSLCGGGGKNKIGYFKSRTGNLVSLDDQNGVVRCQDRSGMSTFQLSKGKIEIIQSSGNIWMFAKEKIRIDCKDMIVNAQENIWQHATNDYRVKVGANQSIVVKGTWAITSKGGKANQGTKGIKFKTGTDTKVGADKMIAITGKGSHNQGGAGVSLQAMGGDLGISSKDDKCEIEAKGNIKFFSTMKVAFGAEQDLTMKADSMIDMSGLMNIKWKGSETLMNAGGSPPGGLSLGKIIGAIIQGAQALAGKIAQGVAGAARAVGAAAAKAAGAVAGAAKAAASALGKVVGAVSKAVNSAANAVGNAVKKVANAVRQAANKVVNAAANVVKQATQAAVGLAKQAVNAGRAAINAGVNMAKDAFNAVAQTAQKAANAVAAGAEWVAGKAQQAGQALVQGIKDAGQAAIDGVVGAGRAVANLGQQAIMQAQNAVQEFQHKVGAAVQNVVEGAGNLVRDGVQAMQHAGQQAMRAAQDGMKAFQDGVNMVVNEVGEKLDHAAQQAAELANQAVVGGRRVLNEAGQMVADGVQGVQNAAGQALVGAGQALQGAGQAMQNAGQGMQNAGQGMQNAGQGMHQGGGQGAGQQAVQGAGQAAQQGAGQQLQQGPAQNAGQAGPGGEPMFDNWGNPRPVGGGGAGQMAGQMAQQMM